MNRLVVRNCLRRVPVNGRLLRAIAEAALAAVASPARGSPAPHSHELGIYLVGDRRMTALNQRYLQHAGPTDVVTFDYGPPEHAAADGRGLRGDIFIGLEVARRQARAFHTSWPAETVRYLVHGLLHLCGHDDAQPAARRRMKHAEDRLVRRLAARFDFSRLEHPDKLRA
jgi:probable rRNA maturation factor